MKGLITIKEYLKTLTDKELDQLTASDFDECDIDIDEFCIVLEQAE